MPEEQILAQYLAWATAMLADMANTANVHVDRAGVQLTGPIESYLWSFTAPAECAGWPPPLKRLQFNFLFTREELLACQGFGDVMKHVRHRWTAGMQAAWEEALKDNFKAHAELVGQAK